VAIDSAVGDKKIFEGIIHLILCLSKFYYGNHLGQWVRPSKRHFSKIWVQFIMWLQTRRFLSEFSIGSQSKQVWLWQSLWLVGEVIQELFQ
jgi:hypothetical protein